MKAVIYTRGNNSQSIEAQEYFCHKFAKTNGLEIVKTFADYAVSGLTDNRPAFRQMIAEAESHNFENVIVERFDRFCRSLSYFADYKARLNANEVKLLSATEQIGNDELDGEIAEQFVFEEIIKFFESDTNFFEGDINNV